MILKYDINDQILFDVDRSVKEVTGACISRIREKNRREPLATIRSIYCCICRSYGVPLQQIADHIRRGSHSTALNAEQDFQHRYTKEKDYRETYDAIRISIEKFRNPNRRREDTPDEMINRYIK